MSNPSANPPLTTSELDGVINALRLIQLGLKAGHIKSDTACFTDDPRTLEEIVNESLAKWDSRQVDGRELGRDEIMDRDTDWVYDSGVTPYKIHGFHGEKVSDRFNANRQKVIRYRKGWTPK